MAVWPWPLSKFTHFRKLYGSDFNFSIALAAPLPRFFGVVDDGKKTAEKTNSELELKNDELAKLKNYQPRYNRRCRVGKNFALGA